MKVSSSCCLQQFGNVSTPAWMYSSVWNNDVKLKIRSYNYYSYLYYYSILLYQYILFILSLFILFYLYSDFAISRPQWFLWTHDIRCTAANLLPARLVPIRAMFATISWYAPCIPAYSQRGQIFHYFLCCPLLYAIQSLQRSGASIYH